MSDPAPTAPTAPPEPGAPDAEGVFAEVRARVLAEHPQDDEARMLRSPGLRTAGKFYAFRSGPDVVVKLPAPRVAALVASGAGRPCETTAGRPMREWVVLPVVDVDSCTETVLEARAFVLSVLGAGTRAGG